MDVIGNEKVYSLFLKAAKELRELGATRVEGLGFSVWFGPQPSPERKPEEQQPARAVSAEARELQERAQKIFGGGR